MSRIIYTNPFSRLPDRIPEDITVITPHGPAAAAARSPRRSLQDLARTVLAERGILAAEPRLAARLLREAVAETAPNRDTSAIARRVGPILRTILRVGIDTGELQRLGSKRAGEAARIAEAYRKKLRELNIIHKDELVWMAASAAGAEKKKLLIYGYPRARKEEIAFIDKIAGDGSIYFLPVIEGIEAFASNAELAKQLQAHGWTIEDDASQPETIGELAAAKIIGLCQESVDGVYGHKIHDIRSEVRYVLGETKKLLRGNAAADEIVIVVRDLDLYVKEFAIAGSEYSVPTRSTLRIPLSETLVGGFVCLLFRALETGFSFEATVRLLGHPLGPGMSDGTWKRSRRERTEKAEQWFSLESSLSILADVSGVTEQPIYDWVKWLRTVFEDFNVRGRAGHIAREIVAYNCFQDELSFLAEDRSLSCLAGFSQAVRDILSSVKTVFDPSRLGVLITEPNIVVGGHFRHLFVLGMAEGILPALPSDNPVIDFHERRFLVKNGIDFEEAADIPRWELLSFFDLISTASESVTLTYPATIGKEGKLESSYFNRLGVSPSAAKSIFLCSQDEVLRNTLRKDVAVSDETFSNALRCLAIERRRESSDPHDEFDGVIGEAIEIGGRQWSVSQLTKLAGCGFQWFAAHALHIMPPEEMDIEVSHAARGKLFHFALHYAVSEGGAKTSDEIIALLDRALAAGYDDSDIAMPRLPNWDLRRADYTAYLTRAVRAADFLHEGSEILATEKEFRITLHGLILRGRIDRIDHTPDGIAAVDYKTSGSKPEPVRNLKGDKIDLQLAVYYAALKELYQNEEIAAGSYYSLSGRKTFHPEQADDNVLYKFFESVIEAPRTGSLPVRPVAVSTCRYCDYDQLCRNGSRIIRKGASSK